MTKGAKEGTCLASLVAMAIPCCQEAERRCPRTGPGRRPNIPDWVMTVLIMVVVAKKKKTKSAQYRYLDGHRKQLMHWLNVKRFPSRTTYFDRYRRASRLLECAIKIQGEKAIESGWTRASCVAVDKSLVRARGPLWHKRDRLRKVIPPGVDQDSTWSYSEHHGWVQGYGYEVIVTAGKRGPVWPLLASVAPAHWREHRTFPAKIGQLPKTTRHILADGGYDSNLHGEAIEWDHRGLRTGCRFLCCMQDHARVRKPAKKPWRETRGRRTHRLLREQRRAYFSKPHSQKLYARRSTTVEPFNEWFKNLFEIHDRLWHCGLDNNRTQILAAIFTYQLLLSYNHLHGRTNGQIQWILDLL